MIPSSPGTRAQPHKPRLMINDILYRADFWALAGIYSVDRTIEKNNDNCDEDDCEVPDSGLVFQWGREVFTLIPKDILGLCLSTTSQQKGYNQPRH